MNEAAAQSQKKVSKLADDAGDLQDAYRGVQTQLLSLKQYTDQIQKLVAAQEATLESLESEIGKATDVARGVTPLMIRMVDALEEFVSLDVPFLPEERAKRVAGLKEMMDRPDVTEAEKYRRIMEAYLIENEFGRTFDAYRGTLGGDDGEERVVEFLRVGRISLIYRTLDGNELGAWNQTAKSWEPLPASYRSALKKAYRMARKQAAPDLVPVPVPAPTEVAQ